MSRIEIQSGFCWDAFDAYLFDIDGTLLHAGGNVHMDSFTSSVLDVMGHELVLDGIRIHGNTDTGILEAAFRQAAITESVWQPRMEEILEKMRMTVYERRALMPVVVHPGVLETLTYLRKQGSVLGLGTGNLERIGWLKVELAGLREWFSFGGFSDQYAVRADMIGHGATQARQLAGENATICVVGDTPSDIAAAKANSLSVIAVATGSFSCDELLEHKPDACVSSLQALLERPGIG